MKVSNTSHEYVVSAVPRAGTHKGVRVTIVRTGSRRLAKAVYRDVAAQPFYAEPRLMTDMIKLEKRCDQLHVVKHKNGTPLGVFYREIDGYFMFEPAQRSFGCWPAHLLREVADKLDELNRPWDDTVRRELT